MPKKGHQKSFELVHIGRCGGKTVRHTLSKNNVLYDVCHLRKPVFNKNQKYFILLRNPLKRTISSFNVMKKFLKEDSGLSAKWRERVSKRYKIDTRNVFKKYQDINILVEKLYSPAGESVQEVVDEFMSIHHLKENISFYLEDFLKVCPAENILGVLATETLGEDIKRLWKLEPINFPQTAYPPNDRDTTDTELSPLATDNLKKYLKKDYDCVEKLNEMGLLTPRQYKFLSKK